MADFKTGAMALGGSLQAKNKLLCGLTLDRVSLSMKNITQGLRAMGNREKREELATANNAEMEEYKSEVMIYGG